MKKLYINVKVFAVLIFFLPMTVNAQLWTEDFDGSNPTNPFDFSACTIHDSRDYFGIVCLDGGPCGSDDINSDYTPGYIGATGSFFGARDINGNPCGTNDPVTATSTGINVSSCSGSNTLYVCFDIAESDTPGREGTDTWDGNQGTATNNTFVTFSASIDGGPDSDIISFAAMGGNNTAPAVDADCNGTGEGAEVTSTFTKYCAEIHTIGNAMNLTLTVGGMNTDGDDVAIDNIEVYCGTPPSGTIVPSCTPFAPPPSMGTSIWLENFDGSNGTNPPTSTDFCSDDDKDYFDVVCQDGGGCADGISNNFVYNGTDGNFFGIRDMDASPCSGSMTKTFGFSGIDVSGCTDVSYLCFDVAESRNIGGAGNPEWGNTNMREDTWDGGSSFFVRASVDGAPFTNVTSIQAFENSDTRPGIDVNCSGKANDAGEPELTSTFTKYCFELPTSGNSLDLEFEANELNGEGEDLALDNIEVVCGGFSGQILHACTPFVSMETLFIENFDGSNTSNPFNIAATGCDPTPSRDYFGIVCNNGSGCANEINSDYIYNGAENQYFGVRDMDNVCGGSLNETITASGIDISSCNGAGRLYLCVDIAESSPNNGREMSGSNEDTWDGNQSNPASNSFVTFAARVDGGATFQVAGLAAAGNNNSGPGIDTDCDGTADGALLTDVFQTFCFDIAQRGGSLDLDVRVGGMNTDGDDVAIDNITVLCTDDVNDLPSTPTASCTPPVTIPTMGEWALIILGLMVMIIGVVAIRQRKLALAGAGTQNANISLKSLPFNKAAFGKTLWIVAGVFLAIFTIAITVFGYELTSADIPGSLVSIPLVAYLVTLIKE